LVPATGSLGAYSISPELRISFTVFAISGLWLSGKGCPWANSFEKELLTQMVLVQAGGQISAPWPASLRPKRAGFGTILA
jgi:hypothetical protein